MNFITKFKSLIKSGNPTIDFVLESNQIKRGEIITGQITLTGRASETPVKMLIAEFFEVITEHVFNHTKKRYEDREIKKLLGKVIIDKNNYLLKENESLVGTFKIGVSSGTWPTTHPTAHLIEVSANVPGRDPRAKKDVFIL